MNKQTMLELVEQWSLFVGKKEYLKYLRGETLSWKEMALAQCYMCTSGYDGGKFDCRGTLCPNYQAMPYRVKEKRQPKKQLSEDHKAKLAAGREKAAKGKGKGAKK